MSRTIRLMAAFLFLAPALAFAGEPAKAEIVRGEYLVRTGGCGDCHTPMKFNAELNMPAPDMSRMLSGHPSDAPKPLSTLAKGDQGVIGPTFTSFKMPIGTAFTANLTGDKKTGLGVWTEAQFVKTMRTGRHLGVGNPILPPMPWFNLGAMTDADLKAVFTYLQSTPAIANAVPGPEVAPEVYANLSKAYEKMVAGAPKPGATPKESKDVGAPKK